MLRFTSPRFACVLPVRALLIGVLLVQSSAVQSSPRNTVRPL